MAPPPSVSSNWWSNSWDRIPILSIFGRTGTESYTTNPLLLKGISNDLSAHDRCLEALHALVQAHQQTGAAAAELALLLPVLIVMFMITVDLRVFGITP